MPDWPQSLFADSPWFAALRPTLAQLGWSRFPDEAAWAEAAAALRTASGHPLRFSDVSGDGMGYEERIWRSGVVATRTDNWHDAYNALTWLTFPRAKAALNALHWRHLGDDTPGRRSRARDAATLFDESGAVVVASDPALLRALQEHDWDELFVTRRADWGRAVEVWIFGHALCEKAPAPFPGIVAKCALWQVEAEYFGQTETERLARVDAELTRRCDEEALIAPGALPPLPLLGIPGWWPCQDAAFYADRRQFRPKRA